MGPLRGQDTDRFFLEARFLVRVRRLNPFDLEGGFHRTEDNAMPHDLPLFLAYVIPSVLVGGVLGLLLRRYARAWCQRYAAMTAAMPRWAYGGFAIFFVILAASQFALGQPSFGTGLALLAVLELAAMTNALFRRVPPDRPAT
jgi:hypothetical protein